MNPRSIPLCEYEQQDRIKTKEINILVKENRELRAQNEKLLAAARELLPIIIQMKPWPWSPFKIAADKLSVAAGNWKSVLP